MATVYRVQLKPEKKSYGGKNDVLNFCMNHGIIGVGWSEVTCNVNDWEALHSECAKLTAEGACYAGDKGVFKAVNAIRQMKAGDFVWTRHGGNKSDYYLCRVCDDNSWINRKVTQEHIKYDITNYVHCEWVHIGTEDNVPGKVVNSFRASATAQRINDVEKITQVIWDKHKGKISKLEFSKDDFWNLIGAEELECLILLYLQIEEGYYIYSSTVKPSTKTYEAVMISKDGAQKCFPQVKQNEALSPENYRRANPAERVVLFSSTEKYGDKKYPDVECLRRDKIWSFMDKQYAILPGNIKAIFDSCR